MSLDKSHTLYCHYVSCEFAPDVLDGNNLCALCWEYKTLYIDPYKNEKRGSFMDLYDPNGWSYTPDDWG